MNTDPETLNHILGNQIQQHIKVISHRDQLGFVPGITNWFNTQMSIIVIYYICTIKDKNY